MTLRDNTRLKSKLANLLPASMRPLAYKIYSFLFETPVLFFRGRPKIQLPADVIFCEVAYNKFGGYCVPLSAKDRPAVKRILASRVYEPDTLDFITSNCGDGDIVHAGTFFGDFLPAISAACGPQAIVWAFEPNSENFRCAKITADINDLQNVNLTHAGLGAERSEQRVQTRDHSGHSLGGASRIVPKSVANDCSEDVDIVAVDDIVPVDRKVSILQLDVEGYEQEALTGSLHTIQRCRPTIILEVSPHSELTESEWFKKNLLDLGYRKTGQLHYNQIFQCE